MNKISDFFFMREKFRTFRLEPDKHNFLLFGKRDRRQRNHLLDRLEEASYSLEGYKSVVIGDYGRGKTHQSRNLEYEIKRRKLELYPVYIKCTEYKTKELFSNFFKELILGIPTQELKRMAQEYAERSANGELTPLDTIIGDEDISRVFKDGLAAPNIDVVRLSMRWLGGEQKLNMSLIAEGLTSLSLSKHFGAVTKGLVQLFKEIKGSVPLFLIDEAERFAQVTHTDSYWSWLAALRELTEIVGVSLIFFIGSKSRDDLPAMFLQDEVMTRIGVSNYVEFYNQGRDDLREFLSELFQTIIRKGPVPKPMRNILTEMYKKEIDETVPDELQSLLNERGVSLEAYPFTDEAFEEFIDSCATSDLSNKPREVLILMQKAASRAYRNEKKFIDTDILEEVTRDGI